MVYNETEFMFVEVKSSNDKLSENQNAGCLVIKYMGFNVTIFKVGK